MKRSLVILFPIAFFVISCSHSVTIKTKEDAVKFLESHAWNGKNVTYRTRGEESSNAAWNGDITFGNNKVIYDGEWSYYTIALDQEGDNNWYFIVTFNNSKMSPITRGTEQFKLFKDGTAKCYPLGTDDGIFAEYDFPEERAPEPVIQNNPVQQQSITLTLVDGRECMNYLKGKTFSNFFAKIIFTSDFHVSIYNKKNNNLVFAGTWELGNSESTNRILELHSPGNEQRFYLNSDGSLEGSGQGPKYMPEQAIHNNSAQQSDATNDSLQRIKERSIKPDGYDSSKEGIAIVISERAYFYDKPDEQTKRKAYMVKGEQAKYNQDDGYFVYVAFTNPEGIETKGYMLRANFSLIQ